MAKNAMETAPTTREGLLALPVWLDYHWTDERAGIGPAVKGASLLYCVDDDGMAWAPVCDREGRMYRAPAHKVI